MSISLTDEARSRLRELETEAGTLTPEIVVADALDPTSPLHTGCGFVWDVQEAAKRNWIEHARTIIRSVVYVERSVEKSVIKVPVYMRDPRAGRGQGYVSIVSLKKDEEHAAEALDLEVTRALGVLRRAFTLASTLGLEQKADAIIRQLRALRSEVRVRHLGITDDVDVSDIAPSGPTEATL